MSEVTLADGDIEQHGRASLSRVEEPYIPDDHFEYWMHYFRQVGDALMLNHVRVVMFRDPCDEDANAESHHHPDSNFFQVRLNPRWEDMTPEQQRETAVHEWMHYLTRQVVWPWLKLKDPIGLLMFEAINAISNDSEEAVTDLLGRLLAPTVPLPAPTWQKAAKRRDK